MLENSFVISEITNQGALPAALFVLYRVRRGNFATVFARVSPMSYMNKINVAAHNAGGLDNDALRRLAPSVFATVAHSSRSERFVPIPTIEIVDGLRDNGFTPYSASQSRTSDGTRVGFCKHMIRFRHESEKYQVTRVGQTVPEVILINANDGGASYQLKAGMFRFVCLNGLVVSESDFGSVRVPHMGRGVLDKVIEGSCTVIEESARALGVAETWQGITLNREERHVLADTAHTLRFADAEGAVTTPIQPEQLLTPRRFDDRRDDLWTTFNVVQENAIRGGLSAFTRSEGRRRGRRVTSREVTGIDGNVKLNQALWALTERMAQLKTGATA